MRIRPKFIALFLLIGLLPVGVVSLVAYITMSGSLVNSTTSQLSSTAIKQEQKITALLQTRQEEIVKLANQYNLQLALSDYLQQSNQQRRGDLATILQTKKIEAPTLESLLLTDTKGGLIASSAIGGRDPVANAEDLTGVVIRKDPKDGFTKLYITTSVTVNKQPAAKLTAVQRTDDLVAVVQDYTGLGTTGETIIMQRDGLSLFPLRFDTEAALRVNVSSLRNAIESERSYNELADYRGKQTLAVARTINTTDWVLVTKIDKDEAFAPIDSLRNALLAILAVVSLIILAVALFFTRLLTHPILNIAAVSERIGRGDFSARLPGTRRDEIGALARSINAMGANLSGMVGSIESQRQRLQVILDSTTEGIFAIDEHDNVILANKAAEKLLLMSPQALVGKNMHDLFDWKHGREAVRIAYDAPEAKVYSDLQYIDSAGAERFAKLIVARVHETENAGATRAIVTIHDETSSRELENMKTDFVSMAAHELRTPLTAVRGYIEVALFKKEHDSPEEGFKYIRQALKNVDMLGGLINNLLDVTRIEKGTLMLNVEKVDLAADVRQTVDSMRFPAEDKKQTITFTAEPSACFVVADPLAIHEVTNNLIANAIKYTPEGGVIAVAVRQNDDACEVAIKDNGIGIPTKAMANLFQKFYRVHGGLASGSGGTGLGLYISKSIVERHNGTIKVESQEGVGSTFTFALPLYTDERLAALQPKEEEQTTNIRRKRGWVTKNIAR